MATFTAVLVQVQSRAPLFELKSADAAFFLPRSIKIALRQEKIPPQRILSLNNLGDFFMQEKALDLFHVITRKSRGFVQA